MSEKLRYVVAYLMWAAVLLLGLWSFVVCRPVLVWVLFSSAEGTWQLPHQIALFDRVFAIVAGLLWIILMVAVEHYFRMGASRRDLLGRFARVAGPLLLLIFVVDLGRLGVPGGSTSWLIMGGEFVIGAALLLVARFYHPARPPQQGA